MAACLQRGSDEFVDRHQRACGGNRRHERDCRHPLVTENDEDEILRHRRQSQAHGGSDHRIAADSFRNPCALRGQLAGLGGLDEGHAVERRRDFLRQDVRQVLADRKDADRFGAGNTAEDDPFDLRIDRLCGEPEENPQRYAKQFGPAGERELRAIGLHRVGKACQKHRMDHHACDQRPVIPQGQRERHRNKE